MTQDEEHLRLLSIFHYVAAAMAALIALFPIIHLVLGLFLVFAPEKIEPAGEAPPAWFGWMFVTLAGIFIVVGWVLAALVLTTGRFLARRKHYLFCLVMAGVECIFIPLGTVLGVFTIIVLMREPVKQLFTANKTAPPGEIPQRSSR